MAALTTDRRDRLRAIAAVVLIHAAAGTVLVQGFDVDVARVAADAIQVFDLPAPALPTPPLPPPPLAADRSAGAEEGAAAPPALRARPKAVVAPEPKVRIPVTPKLAAPKVAADGPRSTSGAAPVPGPGTGAGGQGIGTGSGASGTGPGGAGSGEGGAGLGRGSPARLISGRITRRDYPRSAWREGLARRVGVRFAVGPNGRARGCRVVSTSGNDRIDAITCRTIEQTFEYEPARDARGDPVTVEMVWTQVLWTERD